MKVTRTEIGNIFKSSFIDGDYIWHFFCQECNKTVDGNTHPEMQKQLIKYFNEEVSRKLEGKIKIIIEEKIHN